MKITIYPARNGQWHVRIQSRNGRIMLDAGGYNSARSARRMVQAVARLFSHRDYTVRVASKGDVKR